MTGVEETAEPMNQTSRLTPYLYVLPLLALLAFVFGYPLVRIFEFSFKAVRGINGPWIGLRNYELILSQDLFWESVRHNLHAPDRGARSWSAGRCSSRSCSTSALKGWKLYRVVLFVPYILAIPIIAVVMKKMFQFSGPVNEALRWLGADFLAIDWIGSSDVRALDRHAAHHLAGIGAGHHPVPRAPAQPR